MKKNYVILLPLFICVSLFGCAETKLLEEIGLTTLIGYDLGDEDNVETTAIVRQVSTELQSKVTIITATNATSEGTRSKISRRAAEKIVSGQLRSVLFGDELAKEGIGHYIDTLLKNPAISEGLLLALVEGESRPLLEFEYPDIDDIGEHIYNLLDQNIKNEQMISSTLHEVAHDYYALGKDIAIPIIKRDQELLELSGIALFNKDKKIGELSADDSFYVKLSRDDYHAGTYEMKIKGDDVPSSLFKDLPKEISLVFDPVKTQKDVKLINRTTPEFNLHISMQARLLEIKPTVNASDEKNAKELEKAINNSLSSEISRVIAYTQKVGSDVFGYGEFYRSSVRHSNLTEEKWHEMYKEMKVNVNVDFTLLRSGTFD
ncbi:Ger(x)C family spore germination protein [Sporosarcina sp. Marseille-Q4063]|uniref:Ger(x)C family spore germination protein n=1 Tax=Sporosarcina sp. Marseille-Q4063 TaxID=2810514 RepID=UPI001BB07833|nr:Ger(x)C family spore germination protein [Sporosarcina sp. Marseille-Q4063]QUW22365.1 Ger(x)C family spore germination protein [Sporosarcina sp. Marseille-Q4063]